MEHIFKTRAPAALRRLHALLALADSCSPMAEGSGEVDGQLTYGRKSTSSSAINCGMSVTPPSSSESYAATTTPEKKQQQQENKRKSRTDESRIFEAACRHHTDSGLETNPSFFLPVKPQNGYVDWIERPHCLLSIKWRLAGGPNGHFG